jgi:hypothetical protein
VLLVLVKPYGEMSLVEHWTGKGFWLQHACLNLLLLLLLLVVVLAWLRTEQQPLGPTDIHNGMLQL